MPVEEDRYDVRVYFTRGPGYGDAEVHYNGQKAAVLRGFSEVTEPGGSVMVNDVRAREGKIPLEFLVTGKDIKSSGYAVGLDAFVLEPRRRYIPEWYTIGPFPNVRDAQLIRRGLDSVYAPEKEIDLNKTYVGVNGQTIFWTLDRTPANGRMDLYKYNPYELVVVYALTYVYSPKERTLPLLLGSDRRREGVPQQQRNPPSARGARCCTRPG